MHLAELVEVSTAVAATRSRLAKRDLIAALLLRASDTEISLATAYLSGALPQRRTGLGWRALATLPSPAPSASLSLVEIDQALEEISRFAGPGSAGARASAMAALFGALTVSEQEFLRGLITGGIRQGALDAVMLEAIAVAADLPISVVRRAAGFSALSGPIALAALTGGEAALDSFSLVVGRPVRPMLASAAPDVATGVAKLGTTFAVDTKLDGIRIQVHKQGNDVLVFTRSLDEISARLPDIVALARELPARDLILDGEALTLSADGRPRPFQETASTTSTREGVGERVHPFYFDLLLHDDDQLIERPTSERLDRLDAIVPAAQRVTRLVTDDPAAASTWFDNAVADGQEGVILKQLDAPYAAGRRGAAWVKVKPRHTLDLVVLAVEWGSGRRRGWLSNIHLGARVGDDFVMLGKTFKGMTDVMLEWQTARFLELETHREGHVVFVKPEQVVEITFDGVQRSRRYPGGVALRFARVLHYRDDKTASEADTLDSVVAVTQP